MARLDTDLLFRWFVGLGVDDAVWDATVFSKNRDRLLDGAIAAKFLAAVLVQLRVKALLSSDHFSVDGTLVEAGASIKSFKRKEGAGDEPSPSAGRNVEVDFKGEKRSNETHASTTDPDARLYRKGSGRLCHVVESSLRKACASESFKLPRLPRATCSSPRREACDAFELRPDGVGR